MSDHPRYCTCAANGFWAHFAHAKDCHMRLWLERQLERSGIDVDGGNDTPSVPAEPGKPKSSDGEGQSPAQGADTP